MLSSLLRNWRAWASLPLDKQPESLHKGIGKWFRESGRMDSESPVGTKAKETEEDVPTEGPGEGEIEWPRAAKVRRKRSFRMNRPLVTVGTVAVGFIGLAVLYLLSVAPDLKRLSSSVWSARDHSAQAPLPESVAPVLPRDALADVPVGFRAELLAPSLLASVEISRRIDRPVDQICDYLGGLGFGKFTTMHNPIAEGQWICASDVIPAVKRAVPSDASSVFVWMRGADRQEVDLFRLKVNLTDPASNEAAKSLALTLLGKLHEKLDWDMPEALTAAIRNVSEANFARYGVSYQVMREWSSLPRLNVVIRAIDGSGIVPIDRFSLAKQQADVPTGPAAVVHLKPSIPATTAKPAGLDAAPIESLAQ